MINYNVPWIYRVASLSHRHNPLAEQTGRIGIHLAETPANRNVSSNIKITIT